MSVITLKKINSEISTFTTNRDKLRDHAHVIAMMIFHHAAPKAVGADCQGTGDVTSALRLVKALPASWAAQMVIWFAQYTPVRIVERNDKCEFDPKYKKLTAEEKLSWWKLEEANTNRFDQLTPEDRSRVDILDIEKMMKMVESLGKRIEKKLDENEVKEGDENAARVFVSRLHDLTARRPAFMANVPTQDNAKEDDNIKEEAAA